MQKQKDGCLVMVLVETFLWTGFKLIQEYLSYISDNVTVITAQFWIISLFTVQAFTEWF